MRNLAPGMVSARRVKCCVGLLLSVFVPLGFAAAATELPPATDQVPYSVQLHFQGVSPITVSLASGTLPPGISVSENGLIHGSPTIAADTAYTFTLEVKDASVPPQDFKVDYHLQGLHSPISTSVPSVGRCTPMSGLSAIKPAITSNVADGTKEVSGIAAQPTSPLPGGATCRARVDLWLALGSDTDAQDMTKQTDGNGHQIRTLLASADVSNGKFDIKLSDPLYAGQHVFISEVAIHSANGDEAPIEGDIINVDTFGSWGLVRAYFTSGFLLSQDQGSFSQSSLFLAFTMDKTWAMTSYYGGPSWFPFGVNTFFETRLTAIPVTACAATSGSGGSSTGSSLCPATSNGSGSNTTFDTFLANRKTARLDVGAYFPLIVKSWRYRGAPNSLFLAPIAKLGFDTPAGDLSQALPTSSGTSATTGPVTAINTTNFYTFYDFGGRFGHYAMSSSRDEAPEIVSYLDVMIGRFSNLESLLQNSGGTPFRARLWRLSAEGILKVPSTPLIIGFNANVGFSNPGAPPLFRRAGDDLRFLFGARFDVGKLLAKVGAVSP